MKNIEKYQKLIAKGEVDALLLTSKHNRQYAAEYCIAEGVAVICKTQSYYFTDFRYIESAQKNLPGFAVKMVDTEHPYTKLIKEAISEIVQVEGPISQPALIHTLINSTGLGRAGKNISEHLDKLVTTADVKITRQSGVRFLWNHGSDPADYHTFRFREQRSTEDICKYELKNAVCCLLQENGPMTKEEITKAMVNLLGYSRSSHRIEECAADAIKAARELKAIEQNERKQFVVR